MILSGTSILCTGGTGTFGRAFARYCLAAGVKRFVCYSRDELKQYEMSRQIDGDAMRYFIGDVRDVERLEMAMHNIDVVVHAAAMKRIEVVERDPLEAIKTNVIGSANVILAALRTNVKRAIVLSTDKACDPVNLYGATKMAAERTFVAANNLSAGRCRFAVVRYGNVAGSRGSVIPIWRDIIAAGGEIKITDPWATRFWMTIDDAVLLVVETLDEMKGGEVIMPTLPAYQLGDLAEALGAKSMKIIGLPAYEKRHESLGELTSDKARRMSVEEIREKLKGLT